MSFYVPRTYHEVDEDSSETGTGRHSVRLEDVRECAAYVLLGPPGSGKTRAFQREAKCTGAHYVTARNFLTFDDKPEWHDTTLFIDALDEKRAGSADGRTPLDSIRAKLYTLGRPRFRLSCRDADWFGANDRDRLAEVSSANHIKVLRLDPLSEASITEMLRHEPGVDDEEEFVATAQRRGVDSLLAYPQSLKMLARAVAGTSWPKTRTQTFETACRTLLYEHNSELQRVESNRFDTESLMEAAGRLCALQLLSGSVGYSLGSHEENPEWAVLDRIPGEDRQLLFQVLRTKLFNSPVQGCSEPIHRQVAEFLAGRYLAELIKDGLPAERILALMVGHDGKPVTELRGLAAWLAAHSKDSRSAVVDRDPLGVVLYGDVAEFSTDEKRQILRCLEKDANSYPWFVRTLESDSRLGDLLDPDLGDYVSRILADSVRDESRQSFVWVLMEMLHHGQPFPGIASLMMGILRDGSWWPRIRLAALDVFLRCGVDGDDCVYNELTRLLEDIGSGLVSDPEDELAGDLLDKLYPDRISTSKVLQYLRPPKNGSLLGQFYLFWTLRIQENSTADKLAELLDNFIEQRDRLRLAFEGAETGISSFRSFPTNVLTRLLESSDTDFAVDRLFDWLELASDPIIGVSGSDVETIRSWISQRPELQKEILALGAERCRNSENFRHCMYGVEERLFNADSPVDFAEWCLDQAMNSKHPDIADYFIREVAVRAWSEGTDAELSGAKVLGRLAENPALKATFEGYIKAFHDSKVQQNQNRERHETKRHKRQQTWHEYLKPHQRTLLENQCLPSVLHQLAQAYFGKFIDVRGNTPRERLLDLIGDDERLIDAVLKGLQSCLWRADLPSPTGIMRLGTQDRTHQLALPLIAALEELVEGSPEDVEGITDEQMRLALAVYFTLPMPRVKAHWFETWLSSHSGLVADVLIESTKIKIRAGRDFEGDVHGLARSADYAEVARLAALSLLESFPLRCRERQLRSLRILLDAALLHCDPESVRKAIDRKLGRASMSVAQHVYWLSAAVFLPSRDYPERLERYVAGNERRIRHLAEAVAGRHGIAGELVERLDAGTVESLIRCLGMSFRPYSLRSGSQSGYAVTPTMRAADRISAFIDRLAQDSSRESASSIAELCADDRLRAWHGRLQDAAYNQNLLRREAEFQHCDIEQALMTLENLDPANVADLAALTVDRLRDISDRIRYGSTSNWRQYWNVDSYNRAKEPRPEDACRDRLLSDLQVRFDPLGIDVQPEGHYADSRRSDIRVSYRGFNVPVEIKKSCHRDLWSAARTQLIDEYARDPGAEGYGIYLVFWFGNTASCRPTPGPGKPPKSAGELEERLRKNLSDSEKRKISVLVVDVSD